MWSRISGAGKYKNFNQIQSTHLFSGNHSSRTPSFLSLQNPFHFIYKAPSFHAPSPPKLQLTHQVSRRDIHIERQDIETTSFLEENGDSIMGALLLAGLALLYCDSTSRSEETSQTTKPQLLELDIPIEKTKYDAATKQRALEAKALFEKNLTYRFGDELEKTKDISKDVIACLLHDKKCRHLVICAAFSAEDSHLAVKLGVMARSLEDANLRSDTRSALTVAIPEILDFFVEHLDDAWTCSPRRWLLVDSLERWTGLIESYKNTKLLEEVAKGSLEALFTGSYTNLKNEHPEIYRNLTRLLIKRKRTTPIINMFTLYFQGKTQLPKNFMHAFLANFRSHEICRDYRYCDIAYKFLQSGSLEQMQKLVLDHNLREEFARMVSETFQARNETTLPPFPQNSWESEFIEFAKTQTFPASTLQTAAWCWYFGFPGTSEAAANVHKIQINWGSCFSSFDSYEKLRGALWALYPLAKAKKEEYNVAKSVFKSEQNWILKPAIDDLGEALISTKLRATLKKDEIPATIRQTLYFAKKMRSYMWTKEEKIVDAIIEKCDQLDPEEGAKLRSLYLAFFAEGTSGHPVTLALEKRINEMNEAKTLSGTPSITTSVTPSQEGIPASEGWLGKIERSVVGAWKQK